MPVNEQPRPAARIEQIAAILDRVVAIVESGPQDLVWQQRYRDENELIRDLTGHAARLRDGDTGGLRELSLLFAPTGTLCEIAASNGWLEEYTVLGNRLDSLLHT